MPSLSSLLLCVVVCLVLSVRCQAQCSGSVFTPNTTSAPAYAGTGSGGNTSFIQAMPVQLLQSAIVTGVSIFPMAQQAGVLSIAGGLFSASGSGNTTTMTIVAQSQVVTVTDFSAFNESAALPPLSLPFPQSVFASAGNYRVVFWYSWEPAPTERLPQFLLNDMQQLPTVWMFFPAQINSSDFTTANGVLPAAFTVSPSFTVTPGVLVSVQVATVCSASSSSSSTGNTAPHAAAAQAALPLTLVALLVAVLAVMSS